MYLNIDQQVNDSVRNSPNFLELKRPPDITEQLGVEFAEVVSWTRIAPGTYELPLNPLRYLDILECILLQWQLVDRPRLIGVQSPLHLGVPERLGEPEDDGGGGLRRFLFIIGVSDAPVSLNLQQLPNNTEVAVTRRLYELQSELPPCPMCK